MKLYERLPSKDELGPSEFAHLITEKFCGDKWNITLTEFDEEFLSEIIKKINDSEINYRQFNEILLLLNQNTVSNDFFKFVFKRESINIEHLISGIINLRGLSLLRFGNFRYPFKTFRRKTEHELNKIFADYIEESEKIINKYKLRPDKMLEIEKIPREQTWCLGYIAGTRVVKESAELLSFIETAEKGNGQFSLEELTEFGDSITSLSDKILDCQKIGLKNTDKYLTWDYVDVYIATSMRNQWEFEEVYDFILQVFSKKKLVDLKLRYFDPTQSFCENPRDKGLIEGLMVKRAACTIYLAQESDTMGKDSEMAATLAQGKPVIAYVPKPDPSEYAKKISAYPLSYIKKRFLILQANEMFADPSVIEILKKYGDNAEDHIQDFLDKEGEYRVQQPFRLWKKKDVEFVSKYENFERICNILAEIECYHFEKRAGTLRDQHPLSMQVVLETGVANGVLVVRNDEECAEILNRILTNQMEFEIIQSDEIVNALGRTESYTALCEKNTNSPYRIVTHQERLTNSFWNNIKAEYEL